MSRHDTPDKDDDGALDLRIAEYLRLGVPVATAACAVAAGYLAGPPAVVLVLAGGALVAVIAIFWASIRTLVGETPLSGADAYALGAPRAEEEQKRAVLRALKDLDFERSVGKISEEDYQALYAKYRNEAKRLLRVLEEESAPERRKAEALVEERLAAEGLLEKKDRPLAEKADEEEAPPPKKKAAPAKKKAAEERPEKVRCAKCGAKNDPDAAFCKKCGKRLGKQPEPDEDDEDEDEDDVAESKEATS